MTGVICYTTSVTHRPLDPCQYSSTLKVALVVCVCVGGVGSKSIWTCSHKLQYGCSQPVCREAESGISPVKLWFIKGQSFPDGDLYISVTPEGYSVRYPGLSWKEEERPLAQGIMSQRWNQGCCLNSF